MIYRLIFFFALVSNICSAQKFLHIYGKIEPRSSDTISLFAYNSTFSHLSSKAFVKETVLDADGNYAMKIPWNEGEEINLMNGDNYIVFNIFLNPEDSLEISQVEGQFTTNGKGEENIEYAFGFADKFYIDSIVRVVYSNSFGEKNREQFDKYISDRKNNELKFLEDFNKQHKLSAEAYEVQKTNIIYNYALDKLQYLWKYNYANKIKGSLAVDPSYFNFIKDIKIDKKYAYKSGYYYYFLYEYIDAIWTMQIAAMPDSLQKIHFANRWMERIQLADKIFTGKEKEIAIAANIYRKINIPLKSAGDSSDVQMFPYLQRVGMDKELYNSLLKEYNVINGLEGKPAPAITAITTNGNTFDLESLKGKVVLLDIWSTTCAPCIKAIPESVKLQNELKNKSFVALNLCLNSNEDDWKKLIAKKNWIGTHIFSQNDKEAYSNYHFNSFPQYILIDKNGNIVRTNSERPGNDKLKKEILKLLDQK